MRKIHFWSPKKVDVVIFDSTNSHFLTSVLDKKNSVFEYNLNPPEIWIGIRVVAIFLQKIFSHDFKDMMSHPKGKIYGLFKYLYYVYIESVLISLTPQFVITFIDNSELFGWLSKNCRVFPFIAIQNGFRLSSDAKSPEHYYCQHLFCFGQHELEKFPIMGYHVENFYPAGSIVSSLYSNRELESIQEKYDLLIVSCWRGNIGFQQDVQETMASMRTMDELFAKYLSKRNLKAAVILRAEESSEHWYIPEMGMNERDYYYSIYADLIEIIPNNFSLRPIYPLMQTSKMIVSTLSSALLEGFGMGKKALYYNFCDSNDYHKDFNPLIVSNSTNFEQFSQEVDTILAMPDSVYKMKYSFLQDYYMSFPIQGSTKNYIKEKIASIVLKNNS